jgi:Uma2 family endonuclease
MQSIQHLAKSPENWPQPGQWTYEDYLRLPDDEQRYEIIHGVLYMTNAPTYDHQFAVSELHLQIGALVKQKKLGIVLTAPFEVHLSKTIKPVQPDVFFIAADKQPKAGDKYFEGVPDLIIEVISPSSVRTDRYIKFAAYEQVGVREYWLVDPKMRFVEIHLWSSDTQEYVLQNYVGIGEKIQSSVLPDLVIAVDSIFVPLLM